MDAMCVMVVCTHASLTKLPAVVCKHDRRRTTHARDAVTMVMRGLGIVHTLSKSLLAQPIQPAMSWHGY